MKSGHSKGTNDERVNDPKKERNDARCSTALKLLPDPEAKALNRIINVDVDHRDRAERSRYRKKRRFRNLCEDIGVDLFDGSLVRQRHD